MSKVVRVDDDMYDIIMKNTVDGSFTDALRNYVNGRGVTNVTTMNGLSKEDLHKELEKLKESIRNTNAEFMAFISSGQGAVRKFKSGEV